MNRIPTSYTLHNQTVERIASAKHLGVELTENFHWGKHIQSSAAKANKVSVFAYRNLKECPAAVQTHCYKGLVRPVLEYACVVLGPHQQHLESTLEMVQQWSAHCILDDFNPTSSASALVAQLQLENLLQSKRMSDKVLHDVQIMNGLVDINPAAGLLKPRNRSSRGHQHQLQVPHS